MKQEMKLNLYEIPHAQFVLLQKITGAVSMILLVTKEENKRALQHLSSQPVFEDLCVSIKNLKEDETIGDVERSLLQMMVKFTQDCNLHSEQNLAKLLIVQIVKHVAFPNLFEKVVKQTILEYRFSLEKS